MIPLSELVPEGPAIVAIDGLACSGKSTLAARLAVCAGGAVIATDDFAAWAPDGTFAPQDVDRLGRVLASLACGRAARYRPYDWELRRLGPTRQVASGGIVIVEGVRALHPRLRPLVDAAIWVSCPRDVREERWRARDGEAMRPVWEAWMRDEDAYLARTAPDAAAAIVVDGAPTRGHDPDREAVVIRRAASRRPRAT